MTDKMTMHVIVLRAFLHWSSNSKVRHGANKNKSTDAALLPWLNESNLPRSSPLQPPPQPAEELPIVSVSLQHQPAGTSAFPLQTYF